MLPITLHVDETELQMIYEAVRRVKPFAEMSREMADAEKTLEEHLRCQVLLLQ